MSECKRDSAIKGKTKRDDALPCDDDDDGAGCEIEMAPVFQKYISSGNTKTVSVATVAAFATDIALNNCEVDDVSEVLQYVVTAYMQLIYFRSLTSLSLTCNCFTTVNAVPPSLASLLIGGNKCVQLFAWVHAQD